MIIMRSNFHLPFFLLLSFYLVSCEFNCKVGNPAAGNDENNKPVEKDGALVYNGIRLNTNGVKMKKAYLVVNDGSGDMVPRDNFVDIKKGVKLILLINSGWTETEERVWLGASLKVTTENGELLLNEDDLFSNYDETGLSPDDAKIVGLTVSFKKWEAKQPVSLDVQFKVWDKKSEAAVDGSYTIHSK